MMSSTYRRFRACERGVAAIEFALLAPLLLLLLALSVELGRAYQAYRMFENTVSGVARHLAACPEYDRRARGDATAVATALLPPDGLSHLNMQVTSLRKNDAEMANIFSHTLFGTKVKLSTSDAINPKAYSLGETVIYLEATFDYVPLFKIAPFASFTLRKSYALPPYFTTAYVWNDGAAADRYVQ